MAKTKRKMTKKYWKSLERKTRNKAILMIFGSQAMADMLCDTEPSNPKEGGVWSVIFEKTHIPEDGCSYKLEVNGDTYIN